MAGYQDGYCMLPEGNDRESVPTAWNRLKFHRLKSPKAVIKISKLNNGKTSQHFILPSAKIARIEHLRPVSNPKLTSTSQIK
jgi:hypothetical protein